MDIERFILPPDTRVKLDKLPTDASDAPVTKEQGQTLLDQSKAELAELQGKLYAQNKFAVLMLLQGIDASGKDGTIKHVMSGVNPSGCQVRSFKVPSQEELDHDYLWRYVRALPERGNIGIFNRSYYEEVLVVRVHPELLERQHIPGKKREKFWETRFDEINHFERYLVNNGVEVVKCFLHLSKEEQKKRFLARLDSPDKNWKFSEGDVHERAHWDDYMHAFEDMLSHTSHPHAPWHVVPADQKWYTRLAVATIIVNKLQSLKIEYPRLDEAQRQGLERAKKLLEDEK